MDRLSALLATRARTLACALALTGIAPALPPTVQAATPPLSSAMPAALSPLVSPAELAARLNASPAPRVIDIRDGRDDAGRTPYDAGHIASSVPAPYARWRGPKDNPGALPSTDALTEMLRTLGIDAGTPVVVVYAGRDATDFGAAARVYWTLKAAGVRELAILNGGVTAWRAAGLPLATGPAPQVARSAFTVTLDPRLVATRDEVQQAIDNPREGQRAALIDARPRAFFAGETRHAAAATPGTLVGAKNVAHSLWFAPQSAALLDAGQVKRVAAAQGVDTAQPTVSFCNTGHWAATNWFVLSEVLGHPDVQLYPESMVDWSRHGGAMQNVPGRLQQFWLQLKQATGSL